MNKLVVNKMVMPLLILFGIFDLFFIIFGRWLDRNNINHSVLLLANVLFFLLGLITAFIHTQTLKNNNAYAFVRSITLGSFLKLIVIAAAALIYLFKAGNNRSIYAIIAAMVLYMFYTVIEVRAAMQLNKNRHA